MQVILFWLWPFSLGDQSHSLRVSAAASGDISGLARFGT
jgi:hypothetical protein